MIGLLWGLSLLVSYIGQAWGGDNSLSGLGPALTFFGISTLVGVSFFPRTIGMALSPMFMATPIAFVISLFRHSFAYSMAILTVGILAGLAQAVVAKVRPESAY